MSIERPSLPPAQDPDYWWVFVVLRVVLGTVIGLALGAATYLTFWSVAWGVSGAAALTTIGAALLLGIGSAVALTVGLLGLGSRRLRFAVFVGSLPALVEVLRLLADR